VDLWKGARYSISKPLHRFLVSLDSGSFMKMAPPTGIGMIVRAVQMEKKCRMVDRLRGSWTALSVANPSSSPQIRLQPPHRRVPPRPPRGARRTVRCRPSPPSSLCCAAPCRSCTGVRSLPLRADAEAVSSEQWAEPVPSRRRRPALETALRQSPR